MTMMQINDMAADFTGEVLYDDTWRGRDFTGKRVAVLAAGRDAAYVVPAVTATARRVKLFLDDPDWVLPRLPEPVAGAVRAGEAVPFAGRRARRLLARAHLRWAVHDPWLRRLLTPDDRFTRHATTTSRRYYEALQDDRCKLIRWPVYAITAHGVRTAEGIEHQADCLVIPDPSRLRRVPSPQSTKSPTRPRKDRTA